MKYVIQILLRKPFHSSVSHANSHPFDYIYIINDHDTWTVSAKVFEICMKTNQDMIYYNIAMDIWVNLMQNTTQHETCLNKFYNMNRKSVDHTLFFTPVILISHHLCRKKQRDISNIFTAFVCTLYESRIEQTYDTNLLQSNKSSGLGINNLILSSSLNDILFSIFCSHLFIQGLRDLIKPEMYTFANSHFAWYAQTEYLHHENLESEGRGVLTKYIHFKSTQTFLLLLFFLKRFL